jgi:F0F1-type ATP synthase assembly protein I
MLRLKEQPAEWIKFTAVIGLALNIVLWLLWWQRKMVLAVPAAAACIACVATVVALIHPRWFRGFYRAGMTVSFHIGQVIGKVLLTLLFFIVVTPLGLLLRLFGKDLLQIKRTDSAKNWWHPAKRNREFDRMF